MAVPGEALLPIYLAVYLIMHPRHEDGSDGNSIVPSDFCRVFLSSRLDWFVGKITSGMREECGRCDRAEENDETKQDANIEYSHRHQFT